VEVEIPHDLLAQIHNFDMIEREEYPVPSPSPALISDAANLLAGARRPLIWAGGGVARARAEGELERLATMLGAPVMLSRDAKGALPDRHPLAFTNPRRVYSDSSTEPLLLAADVVFVEGSSFAKIQGEALDLDEDPKVVHVDVDPAALERAHASTISIEADARAALAALCEALEGKVLSSRWEPYWLGSMIEDAWSSVVGSLNRSRS
jgi:thiamine pyrophosphate-dependent acetolactate synthase large subunit-like protein